MKERVKVDKRIYNLEKEKPYKAVLKMGLPVTMGMLFMIAYNLVDTFFIGMLNDEYQLAAPNFAYPLLMVMIALSGIVGNGGASYLARCMGAGEMEIARRTLTIGFQLIILFSALVSVFGYIYIDEIVDLLGAEENTFAYTKDYSLVLIECAILVIGNYAVGQLLRSEGSIAYSTVGMIAGALLNVVLDPLFIFTFEMGVKGAAIATVIGNALSIAIYMFCYLSGKSLIKPELKYRRERVHNDVKARKIVAEIMWVGIPHTIEQLFSTVAIVLNNNLAVAYSEATVAATGVANKLMTVGEYLYQGMTAGCQPLMGYNYGAKKYARLQEIMKAGIFEISIMELVVLGIFAIFAPELVGLFTDKENVIEIGAVALRAFMLYLPFVSAIAMTRNFFNSIGKPMYAFVITFARQICLYIPIMLIMNSKFGFNGLIHSKPMEECISFVAVLIILFGYINKLRNREELQEDEKTAAEVEKFVVEED